MVPTFVINLEESLDRKKHMTNLLKRYPDLDVTFIKAINGKLLSNDEKDSLFNSKKFKEKYSVNVRPGEIGCTLSHQKCYKEILKKDIEYALILEDDIYINEHFGKNFNNLIKYIDTDKPTIILLSAGFTYTKSKTIKDKCKLANIYHGYFAHSYLINNAAAKIMIEEKPYIVADEWTYYKKKGVNIYGVIPHLVNQIWDDNINTIISKIDKPLKKSFIWKILNIKKLLSIKILKAIGHFEDH